MIYRVYSFHRKFGLPLGETDKLIDDPDAQQFRVKFIQEELDELKEALNFKDKIATFDALLDLAYVVYGTALFAGINPLQWYAGMDAVHKANMDKVRVNNADDSKRGSSFDVKKPDGWVSPESKLKDILDDNY